MQDQGANKFKEMATKIDKGIFVLSPQSRVSLANYYEIDEHQFVSKLMKYFQRYNIDYILDMNFFIDIAIHLCKIELQNALETGDQTPLITSECPGWICY